MIDIIIAITRLVQNSLPLPNFQNPEEVEVWLKRIAGPLAVLISMLAKQLGGRKLMEMANQLADELGQEENKQRLSQFEQNVVDGVIQILVILSDMVER